MSSSLPESAPPNLAPGAELLGEYKGSGLQEVPYLVRHGNGRVTQLSRLLYLVAANLDGQRSHEEVAERVTAEFGRRVSAGNVEFLIREKLVPLGLIAGDGPAVAVPPALTALTVRTAVFPPRLVAAASTFFSRLFHGPVIVGALSAFVAIDAWLFLLHGVGDGVRQALLQPGWLLLLLTLGIMSMALHEIGHAAACTYGGAVPGAIGVGIYAIFPVFYCDVTDAYRLGKAGRIRTDLAGVYFNVVFILAVAELYFLTGFEPLLAAIALQHIQIFIQLVPVLRLDGYYLVSDLTGVPDLFARIRPILAAVLTGRRRVQRRVAELKPSVRIAVTAWVFVTVAALSVYLGFLAFELPNILDATGDTLRLQSNALSFSWQHGNLPGVLFAALQMIFLVIPFIGLTLLLFRALRRGVRAVSRRERRVLVPQAAPLGTGKTEHIPPRGRVIASPEVIARATAFEASMPLRATSDDADVYAPLTEGKGRSVEDGKARAGREGPSFGRDEVGSALRTTLEGLQAVRCQVERFHEEICARIETLTQLVARSNTKASTDWSDIHVVGVRAETGE